MIQRLTSRSLQDKSFCMSGPDWMKLEDCNPRLKGDFRETFVDLMLTTKHKHQEEEKLDSVVQLLDESRFRKHSKPGARIAVTGRCKHNIALLCLFFLLYR